MLYQAREDGETGAEDAAGDFGVTGILADGLGIAGENRGDVRPVGARDLVVCAVFGAEKSG